jgi:hypothetical protein
MKYGVSLLRMVAVVWTSLALTACLSDMSDMSDMTEEEATAVASEELVSQTSTVGSCANWSGWAWDGTSATCNGVRLSCGTFCDEFGNCGVNPATTKQEYSYRVCFDQNGNYTHTEYQYRDGAFLHCGC